MSRFVLLYFFEADADAVRAAIPDHVRYWKDRKLPDWIGGPFGDRGGGMICFSADSLAVAEAIAAGDPFVKAGILAQQWVKEWDLQ